MPFSRAPTRASVLASSISLARFSIRRSLSPRDTNSRKRRMIWPARSAWSAALPSASRSSGRLLAVDALEQALAALAGSC